MLGLFHARKLSAHQFGIERLGWDRIHPTLHITTPVLRALHPRDQRERLHAAPRRPGAHAGPARGAQAMKRVRIVLHTHMPYVEGFGTWPFGEEWLWEAIATSYLPLLDVLDRHPGKVTLSITPVLADQLEAPGALERCLAFLREVRPARPRARPAPTIPSSPTPRSVRAAPPTRSSAVATSSRRFGRTSRWTSAATHAVLPLLATDAGVRLQVETGIAAHRRRFGAWHGGFWLPECAHAPWLDALLEEAGVHFTCVDWTDVGHGAAPDRGRDRARPARPPGDRSRLGRRGYPSHGDYRDTNRLTPRAPPAWAVDGEPYDPERGHARARAHAEAFVNDVTEGAVVAFDTELFGHHWHEGVTFLERVLELADVVPVAVSNAPLAAPVDAPPTSWGTGRDLRTWSAPRRAARVGPASRGIDRAGRGRRPARAAGAACAAELGLGVPDRERERRRLPARARRRAPRGVRDSAAGRRQRACDTSRPTWRLGICRNPEFKFWQRCRTSSLRRCVECRPHKSRVPSGLSGRERGNRWSAGRAPGANRRH